MPDNDFSSPETAEAVLEVIASAEGPISNRAIGLALNIGRTTAACAVRRLIAEEKVTIVRKGTGNGYATRYQVIGEDS
jgi:hypothetical protein